MTPPDLERQALQAAYAEQVGKLFSVFVDGKVEGLPEALEAFRTGLALLRVAYVQALAAAEELA
jgi:TPP-dependent trihydroxycyclohexane-1,2-dione (THcHDO) dehydratase